MSRVRLRGIGASSGIAIGPAVIVEREEIQVPRYQLEPAQIRTEIERLHEGINASIEQLESLRNQIQTSDIDDHAMILDAHLLILKDDMVAEEAVSAIKKDRINAEWAVKRTVRKVKESFSRIDDAYLRERSADVVFVTNRLLRNLMGFRADFSERFRDPSIIISHELSPADTVHMLNQLAVAFCTDVGTRTSHTAIMAKALGIPAVVGLEVVTQRVAEGDLLIVDGTRGQVILRPDADELAEYEEKRRVYEEREQRRLDQRDLPAKTKDNVDVLVMGNIELPGEAALAMDHGAAGIGLYRTEFLFIDRAVPPDEDEQYGVYRAVVETVAPGSVTLRTFDLGGDKFASRLEMPRELNPALGLRAVRLGLKEPRIFKTQLKAMLRAGVHGKIRIMFPMISGVGEFRQACSILREAINELRRDHIPFAENVPVGSMIELPSAVMTASHLAEEADFFSIGTNDLIQYSLAIDRGNEHVAYMYHPLHPAILTAISTVVDAGAQSGIKVSMCGAMAEEPLNLLILLGLGLREISVAPSAVPSIKEAVREIDIEPAKRLTAEAMKLTTVNEIEKLVNEFAAARLPTFLED